MSQIISSNRRRLAKSELIELAMGMVEGSDTAFIGTYEVALIESAVDHICDAVHEEIRGWLRAEGVIE